MVTSSCGKVLIVEDEWLIAATLEDTVAALGYEVIGPVPSVRDALGLIEREKLDFALLDISLGREKSFPIAERLKEAGVPFAFLTGYLAGNLPEAFVGISILAKPVCELDLLKALPRMERS
jgi:two-component SAPR family response regulator